MKNEEKAIIESRRFLTTLLSNIPGMVYRCLNDRDWTMEFVSMGSIKVTAYSPEELINNNVISYNKIIHPDDRDMVWEEVQKAVNEGRPFEITYRIIAKDGSTRWVWNMVRPSTKTSLIPLCSRGISAT